MANNDLLLNFFTPVNNQFLRTQPTRYLAPKFNLGRLTTYKCNIPTEKLYFAFTSLCFVETGAELCRMGWPLPHLSGVVHLNTLRTLFSLKNINKLLQAV